MDALQYCAEQGKTREAAGLLNSLGSHLSNHYLLDEFRQCINLVSQSAIHIGDPHAHAYAYESLVRLHITTSTYKDAIPVAEQGIGLFERAGDHKGRALMLYHLQYLLRRATNTAERSIAIINEIIGTFAQHQERGMLDAAHQALGVIHREYLDDPIGSQLRRPGSCARNKEFGPGGMCHACDVPPCRTHRKHSRKHPLHAAGGHPLPGDSLREVGTFGTGVWLGAGVIMAGHVPADGGSLFMSADRLPSTEAAASIDVHVRGVIGPDEADHARGMIACVLAGFGLNAGGARVRMAGPLCGPGPGLVQVNVLVHGAQARVQVPGPSIQTAVALATERLQRQIRRLAQGWEPWPWPDPQRRMLAAPFDAEVARVKDVRLQVTTPGQATAAMNAMDYDVHLFTDAETGEDAVVYRAGPTGIRMARQHSMHPIADPVTLRLTINPRKVPTLTVDHAEHRLASGWLPFVFFTEVGSGRGNLLYRRYDGDVTLVHPAGGAL